jgi:hypothetical protein
MKLHGVKLLRSTAFHPQTDDQSEALNKALEGYLRCMTGDVPNQWSRYLSMAEMWYNTKFHSAIQMTPFEALYGYKPTIPCSVQQGESIVEAVDYSIKTRDQLSRLLHDNLTRRKTE